MVSLTSLVVLQRLGSYLLQIYISKLHLVTTGTQISCCHSYTKFLRLEMRTGTGTTKLQTEMVFTRQQKARSHVIILEFVGLGVLLMTCCVMCVQHLLIHLQ